MMDTMNKSLIAMYSFFALIAGSAVLEACSKIDIEHAAQPLAQPLMAAPIKTSSNNFSDNYIGLEPQTVTDVNGNTTAVWEEYDGARFNIWTMRRVAGESWGTASLLETDNAGHAYSPQVAVDGIGNVTAVWKQSDGNRFGIYVNRFINGKGWEGVTQIRDGATSQININDPVVTYDASGYAMVAWQESVGMNSKTWVKRHVGDANWGATTEFVANAIGTAYPRFAVNAMGELTVVAEKPTQALSASSNTNAKKNNEYRQVSIYSKRYQ
jgi:hypothetical protein